MKIAIVGAGSWGTAVAHLLGSNGHEVQIWSREQNICDSINKNNRNPVYLQDIQLPKMLASTLLEEVLSGTKVVVNAVPTAYLREVMPKVREYLDGQIVLSLTKGIEVETGLRASQILEEELAGKCGSIAVLSGPNLAKEVAHQVPSATVIASRNLEDAKVLQGVFMAPYFRVYTNHDLVGVELGGALKNIIALAAGISDGIGFGDNSKASLITRGLVEMKGIAKAMGAEKETLSGLSGMGDLIATCSSQLSRNRTFGEMIGRGKTLEEAQKELGMVAEGVKTSLAVRKIIEKLGIEAPICRTVEEVLFENLPPKKAVIKLMTREAKHEVA